MTYSAGGLIEATDYNNFAGGNGGGANVSGQLNTVYGTGYGNAGYGQTLVSNVSVAAQVTATQWTTLVNGVNAVRKHQSGGSFTNLSTYVAGDVINATNDVSTNLTTAYTNRLTSAAAGPTYNQPTQAASINTSSASAVNFNFSRTATFGSSDQARYFFNAGGTIEIQVTSTTNTGGTTRGAALLDVIDNCTTKKMSAITFSAITTPAPFTENTDVTTLGYYGQTSANVEVYKNTGSNSGSAYNAQYAGVNTKVTGTAGSNGGVGEVITFSIFSQSPAQSPAFDDSINVTVNHRLQVVYPSTTYLANTWGSVTFG